MIYYTNNIYINKKIDAFYADKVLSSQKELLDVYKQDDRYVYKVKCNKCGDIRITHSLKDCYVCSKQSQCYKDKMSKTINDSKLFKESRQKIKENWTSEKSIEHRKRIQEGWTKEKRLLQSKIEKNYWGSLSDELKKDHSTKTKIGMPKHGTSDFFKMKSKQSDSLRSLRIALHPNLSILYDKDKLYNYLTSLDHQPSLSELSEFFGISNHYIVDYIKTSNLLYLINYEEPTASLFQLDVEAFIKSLNIPYQHNVHSVLSNKRLELDIYIPSHNLAIECNGLYYHYYPVKDKDYHYNKSRLCEEKGIRLIHIWENEWYNERQQPILKSIIKNALGLTSTKVYARNTYCSVEPSASLKDFVNQNNIAGFRGGKFAITLRDKHTNELLMCYIIGNAYFGKGKYQYEVIRGATKLDTTVIGGASKIWHYFIDNYEPQSCVYYIDYNYFNGNSLPNLGLQFITSQPGFKNWFILTDEVLNRDPQHHKEISELVKRGLVREIYNAGTKVYLYTKEKHNN